MNESAARRERPRYHPHSPSAEELQLLWDTHGGTALVAGQTEPSGSPDDRSAQVRVVWNGRTDHIEGVRLRRADKQTYRSVRPTERLVADVHQAFAHFVADDIVATVWPAPVPGTVSPVSSAKLLDIAEQLLDPQLLAAGVVRVLVQIAAVHAGIPPPVAHVMGQAAGDLFLSVVSPDPAAGEVQAVRCVDLALSAEDGSVIGSPALSQIAGDATADVIDRLLAPDDPPEPLGEPEDIPASPWRDQPPSPPVPAPPDSDPAGPHPDPASTHPGPASPYSFPASPPPASGPSKRKSPEIGPESDFGPSI